MMGMDEPTKPEFASPFSYIHFANKVKSNRRYVWAKEVDAFLETVLQTVANRITDISEGTTLYRAQHGVREEAIKDEDGDEIGFRFFGHKKQRMKPRSDKASEGRVNPTGIPVLYLASQIKTAISEIRPWVGSQVSVARMDIRRDLKLVDLSEGHGQVGLGKIKLSELEGEHEPSAKTKAAAVWTDIDSAFSRPVILSEHPTEYVPTQILAELFKSTGFDGLLYRSQFGVTGYNIALFDIRAADFSGCQPFSVKGIEVEETELGDMLI